MKLENFQWDSTKREVRLIDFGSSGLVRPGKLFSHPCGSLSYIGTHYALTFLPRALA